MTLPRTTQGLLVLFLLLFLSISGGCKSEQQPEDKTFVQINEERISKTEFDRAFAQTLLPEQQLSSEERLDLKRTFLVQLIDRELIFLEARHQNIEVSPQVLDAAMQEHYRDYPDDSFKMMLQERGMTMESWQAELKQSLIMEKLLNQVVYPGIVVTDDEIEAYYKEHRSDFDRPAQVRARQIVVADEEQGHKVLALLRQGEDFAAVARKYSLSPDAEQGGDLGFFERGRMPAEFDATVFDLPVGRLSDLVKSEYGYHIFLVEEKRTAARLSQQEAAGEIRRILETHKQEEAYQEWLQGLRSRAEIEVDWNQLEK